jgi:D-glycero-D-manno-heptose 1,7-bisphosphate phosphatase
MNQAVFLDRDGVLTKEKIPPKRLELLKINNQIYPILKELKRMGYLLFCITNQPDIARGTKTKREIEEVNDRLWVVFPEIISFTYCPHDDADLCSCRKPMPGMIYFLAKNYDLVLSKSWVVGDSWRDVGAGYKAGCKTIQLGNELPKDYIPDYKINKSSEILKILENNFD